MVQAGRHAWQKHLKSLHQKHELLANNSFKPNLLRYIKHMAEKACHVFASATQVGLTQVLEPC